MHNPITLPSIAIAIAMAAATCNVHAAQPGETTGPYLGIALGGGGFGTQNISAPKTVKDESDGAFKLSGGYQLTDNFGLEAGFVRLGKLQDSFTVGGTTVKQSVSGRSIYLAGTGRLPLGESFALTGKLGLSFGKASGTNRLSNADSLIGSKRSLMVGIGGEYRLNRDITLTADLESYGKLSNKVSAGGVFLGARFSF
jgi:OOP family OmpA-OmpF porin